MYSCIVRLPKEKVIHPPRSIPTGLLLLLLLRSLSMLAHMAILPLPSKHVGCHHARFLLFCVIFLNASMPLAPSGRWSCPLDPSKVLWGAIV